MSAPNRSGIFSIDIDLDFTRRQLTDDVEKPTCREGGSALLFHFCFKTSANADIEIRGREMHFAVGGLEQDVGKNRQRRARADDILDLLQTFEQLFFRDAKLHEGDSA